MIDMNLPSQQLAEDYSKRDPYYNYMLICFYVTRISKQCARFNERFPYEINFHQILTDKYVLTTEPTRATMGRNFDDTHFVEDTYYNIARYIYKHPNDNKQPIIQYLVDNNRSKKKPFAMQYLIGAIEAGNIAEFKNCMDKVRKIEWDEANW